MRKLWNEFKSFAMSGNMLDLALGFIIGGAFAVIIQSLANNVLMQLVAAAFGKPDFTKFVFTVHSAQIKYGQFLTDLVNFLLLAALLFGVVKFIVFIGIGRGRSFGIQECPFCEERIPETALVCRFCRQALVDELPTLAQARERFEEMHRRKLVLPSGLPIGLPLVNLPVPGRRKTRDDDPGAVAPATATAVDIAEAEGAIVEERQAK
jgi:large conductance mechanosensitive channel